MDKKQITDIIKDEEKPFISLSRLAEKFHSQPNWAKSLEFLIGGVTLGGTLTSCRGTVTPQPPPPGPVEQIYYNVPYVAQAADSQLAEVASTIMVLNYYGENLSMETFKEKITSSGNIDYNKLIDYLNDNNYTYDFFGIYPTEGIDNIKKVLERGPVMIKKESNLDAPSSNPYRVLIGWDDNKETFITHDPIKGKNFEIKYEDFFDYPFDYPGLREKHVVWPTDICWTYEIRPENKLKDDMKKYQEQAINIVDSQMKPILGKF